MPRLLMNFQDGNGWTCHFLEADCRTPMSDFIAFRELEDLRAFYLRSGPEDVADFDHCIRAWAKGSVWVNVTEEQYAKLKQTRLNVKR